MKELPNAREGPSDGVEAPFSKLQESSILKVVVVLLIAR